MQKPYSSSESSTFSQAWILEIGSVVAAGSSATLTEASRGRFNVKRWWYLDVHTEKS